MATIGMLLVFQDKLGCWFWVGPGIAALFMRLTMQITRDLPGNSPWQAEIDILPKREAQPDQSPAEEE